MDATATTIEMVDTLALIPYAANARTHSPEQVEQIAVSMDQFGWTNPVLINATNGIIAGHGRVQAAALRGITPVPCIRLSHLSPAQERALILADNKIALNAGWDDELLRAELQALIELDFDIGPIGFNDEEMSHLFRTLNGETDPEDVPEPPDSPVSKPGDVWILGHHRIVCGSSTDPEDVAKALAGEVPHLMVTDPPYGVEYDASWRNTAARQGKIGQKKSTRAIGKVENDDRADWREAWALFPGDVAYIWHAGNKAHIVAESLMASGLEIRAQIIWAKNNIVIGRGDYHPKHEPCWYAVRKGRNGHWQGSRKESTVWDIDKPMRSETGHSTQKPVECMQRPIENNSKAGERIYEPFSGSGTTIIAGEMSGRIVHAIELNPAYVDVAVNRWQNFTGRTAVHAETGEPFPAPVPGPLFENEAA